MLKDDLKLLFTDAVHKILFAPGSVDATYEALDDFTEDVQAVVIKDLHRISAQMELNDEALELELATDDLFVTRFGATLFNLVTMELGRPSGDLPNANRIYYSARKRIVRAMLRTLLEELQADKAARQNAVVSDEAFAVLSTSN